MFFIIRVNKTFQEYIIKITFLNITPVSIMTSSRIRIPILYDIYLLKMTYI